MDKAADSTDHLRAVIDPNDADGIKNQLIDRIHWQALRRHLPQKGKVLDFGCGVGRMARRISERGLDYTGADVSPSMIEAARAANANIPVRFVHFTNGSLPLADAVFDAVFTVMVYQYVVGGPDNSSFVGELRRIVGRNGRLIMIEQASLSGQSSGTVSRTTTPDDYVKFLSPYFRVDSVTRIRSSVFAKTTHRLFSVTKRINITRGAAVPLAAAIERGRVSRYPNSYFGTIPYFDVVISATPIG